MSRTNLLARILVVLGLGVVLVGSVDPLEGSVLILLGLVVLAFETWLVKSGRRRTVYVSAALAGAGVAALFILSAMGGVGGRSGHSWWWLITLLPYPAGWLMGLISGVCEARAVFKRPVAPGLS